MASLQETVDEIRGYVAAGSRVPTEACAARADEYAQACREANDRLRKCNDALQRGLRSDAIHLAEAEPNLLDVVAMLDFPELASWKALCNTYELTSPPELLIEMASALNEAYADEQPLVNLMATHRVMALARAPLPERLTVMRRIAELDPASGFWADDIQKFEQSRLDEIRSQLGTASKAQNAAAVSRLNEEIDSPSWQIAIPPDLSRSVKETADRLVAMKATNELRALLPKLNDAYGGMSYEESRMLLGQWLAIVAAARLVVPADLQDQIEPILGWVHEQDHRRQQQAEFDETCNRLVQALDTDQPTPALERAYQATLSFHLEMPEELDRRYRQRLAARASAIRQRRRLMYTGIAAGFVLIAGAIAAVFYQHMLSGEINDGVAVLTDATKQVQQGELDKGESVKKQLLESHPRIASSPSMMKAISDFDAATVAERQRESDFQKHMHTAVSSGTEKPAQAELDQAAALAKTASEIAQVEQFKSSVDQFRTQRQQETDRKFAADGSALGADLDSQLPTHLMTSNPDGYGKQLEALTKRVEELRQRSGISSELKQAQLASLDAVLQRHQQDFSQQQAQGHLLEGVKNFGSTAAKHADSLKLFISTCPGDTHGQDFQTEVQRLPAEQAVEDWATIVARWSPAMLPATYDAAKDRAVEVQQYLDSHPNSPLLQPVQTYLAYLKMGLDTLAPDGPWKGKLGKLLDNPVVGKLYCLDTVDGLRFYVTSDIKVQVEHTPDGEVRSQTFDAVTVPDLTHPSQVKVQLLKSTAPAKSPQAVFAANTANQIDALTYLDWDVFGMNVIGNLVAQKEINPVLKAILLQHILQLNQPIAAWSGQADLGTIADGLAEQNVEDIEWLDPRHAPDTDAISKLQSMIAKLPLLSIAKSKVLAQRQAVLGAAEITLAGEGILLRENNAYHLQSSSPCSAGQTAMVIGMDNKLEQLAVVRDSHWSVDNPKAGMVPDGSLVFIVLAGK